MGKTVTMLLNGQNSQQIEDLHFRRNKMALECCLSLPMGYIQVYDDYFQISFSLKPFGQSKPNFMWSLHGQREHKLCKNGHDHMTKMATMPIYGKTFKIYFSRTESPMILKFDMHHWGLKLYIDCINGDRGLTLTY